MILSRTSQYAVQALIYIATRPSGEPVLNREIASYLGVPPAYLAKIMQHLCKGNLLYSYRGRLGGFCLREGAEKTGLMQILTMTEGQSFTQECVLGLKVCSDATACPMHAKWVPIKKKIVAILNDQTLEKLARAVQTGKYRLTDLPATLLATSRRK
jgi:Rrf2 family iron-sulfur cluster assembly transcriptional regulator